MKLLPSPSSAPTSLNSSAIRLSVSFRGGSDPSDDGGPDPASPTTLLPVTAASAAVGSSQYRICVRIRSDPVVVTSRLEFVPKTTSWDGPNRALFWAEAVAEPPALAPTRVMLSWGDSSAWMGEVTERGRSKGGHQPPS